MSMKIYSCPVCWDNISGEEREHYGMCRECFVDELCGNVRDEVLRDFLREYRYELTEFVEDNYQD